MEEPEMQLKWRTSSRRACTCWPTSPRWRCSGCRSTCAAPCPSWPSTSRTCRAGRSRAREPFTPWSMPAEHRQPAQALHSHEGAAQRRPGPQHHHPPTQESSRHFLIFHPEFPNLGKN
ncbi:BLOC-1-related complex subunit 8 isoform X2 [Pyrgilauda ruficollis]|uniref:BLOC-1-related complex subunit 8 isoform X2 n=1 Tax=Pyrgilauda ruficollis TaxID=221976 RepID=UPI001B883DCC|nr:BLOC-1-related complex subunit 8 isoform X2 [Pyrgilauda ruficollis]XP_041327026.1 BLOC-1-related complex subunit 8 isoform X2 [Pyrgilauda ruficollis]